MWRAVGPALLLGIVLAACGGSGNGNSKPSAAGDRATADRINLKPTDFPAGWTSAPHQGDADSVRQFFSCLAISDPATRFPTVVHSPDFNMGQNTSASSEVRMARSDADAVSDLAAYQSSKGPPCFEQTIKNQLASRLPPGATANVSLVTQFDVPPVKDGSAAYQATLTLATSQGINVLAYVDLVIFRAGRAEVFLNGLNTGSPLDPNVVKDLMKKMADRS